MADYTPLFAPGRDVTYTAAAPVTAGQVVEITTDRTVGPAGAASTKYVGVALFDAAAGDLVTVQSGGVHRLLASVSIAAGDRVAAAANGEVATGATASIGTAIAAAASGALALIKLDH
jgi:predicted RecA/RadA family phage recombinase